MIDKIFYSHSIQSHTRNTKFDYNKLNNLIVKKLLNGFNGFIMKYPPFYAGEYNEFSFDVTNAIDNCKLTKQQKKRLDLWMEGYNEREIAEKEEVARWVISKGLATTSQKILDELLKEE